MKEETDIKKEVASKLNFKKSYFKLSKLFAVINGFTI